ncbi:MAG TPA: hypothetical protein VGM84_25260 [Steroidobacteraceae bacterium]
MSLKTFVDAVRIIPSITTWTRLEPLPRQGSMARSLQAQVRDPVWFLTRQWQLGEFLGDDAGSPVQATLGVEQRTLTTYRPGLDDSATVAIDLKVPLETHVEREPVTLNLRGAVQHGLYFEKLVRASGVLMPDSVITAFRATFPIAGTVPPDTYPDADSHRFRSVAAGRVTDGEALYVSASAVAAGQTPPIPLPPQAADPKVATALSSFVAYRRSLFSEPDHDPAWQSGQLDYAFALGSPAPGQSLLLNAPDFPGGHLDWYSFDLDSARPNPVAQSNPAQITTTDFTFLPNHVVFRGMPDPRWWNFEDAVTDFGQLDADHVDLAKLLVMEFALVYGNDWFSVPVPTPIGALERVTTLVVTDTFGVRTLIRPSEQTQVNPGETAWSMFKLSGSDGARSQFISMAPTVGIVEDADALEEVIFLRDDQAAMAWAVEHQLQSDLDSGVNAYEAYLTRLKAQPLPSPPQAQVGGPEIYYTLETPVPDNWIPMVPVQSPQGELYLRRGTMEIPAGGGTFQLLKARAVLLEPQHAFLVADRVISRAGVVAQRYFRRARGPDGSTHVWLARETGPGTGPGWSGLRFDIVRPMAGAASK